MLSDLVHDGTDGDLARINALDLASRANLNEDRTIAALLHATRLGLFESSWNVCYTSCRGMLDTSANLKGVKQDPYACAFRKMDREPVRDARSESDDGIRRVDRMLRRLASFRKRFPQTRHTYR